MVKNYAEVLVDLPTISIQQTFYYFIPENLKEEISFGSYVEIPFGKRRLKGFVVGFKEEIDIKETKNILRIIEKDLFSEKILNLAKWVSSYYFSPVTEVLHCIIPPFLKKKDFPEDNEIDRVKEEIEIFLGEDELIVFENIKKEIENKNYKIFLIQGDREKRIKIYLKIIEYVKNSVIFLVPEISFIKEWEKIFKKYFWNIGILHSELSKRERFREWEKIKNGKAKIILGTRLAVFAPTSPDLIIIEEEQESSYKQISTPRYNAREVAKKRGELENIILILGSSTPSLESYFMYGENRKNLYFLKREKFPQIKIIDMRKERKSGNRGIFSNILGEKIKKNFLENKKIFIFLNRRGYSHQVVCLECGNVIKCPNCGIPLSYHLTQISFLCHYCNFKSPAVSSCPNCKGVFLKYKGIGIQRVEEEIKKIINSEKILRIDSDSISDKNFSEIKFEEINIILGTTLSLKSLPFNELSLVGVINPDISLSLLDFRSAEKTYQLLNNLINKLGNRTEVVIQTYFPNHYVIEAIKFNDYLKFYKKEIKIREELNYPPFSHLINIMCLNEDEEYCKNLANKLKEIFLKFKKIEILGPANFPYFKKKFRYQILLKIKDEETVINSLKEIQKNLKYSEFKNIIVDVDPAEIF